MKKQLTNPYLPSYEYIPDGEPHVFNDRLYIFGSHDRFKGEVYCMNDYACWSAPVDDISDWRYEGIIYKREQDPTPMIQFQTYMWAPDVCMGKDGRYYLYYGLESLNRIGVAVSDTPAGKYEYYGEIHYPDGTRYGGKYYETVRFDPAVLNDNGRIFFYDGFSTDEFGWLAERQKETIVAEGNTVLELGDDMLTIIDGPKTLIPGKANSKGTGFEGHEFFEASSIRKFDGKYYAIYSSVLGHELAYAVSDYPDRGFEYGGTLHSNGGIIDNSTATFYYGNNHGSIERVNGTFYLFGHRQTYKNESSRQGIAEVIEFKDGRFVPAEMTSQGLNGKPLLAKGVYEAGIACILFAKDGACHVTKLTGEDYPYITQDGEDREDDPGQYIARIKDGTVVGYRYFDVDDSTSLILNLNGSGTGEVLLSNNLEFMDAVKCEISDNRCVFDLKKDSKTAIYLKFNITGETDLKTIEFNKRDL